MFLALPGLLFLIIMALSWKRPPVAAKEKLIHLKIVKKSL
jgi:hypothetical protein